MLRRFCVILVLALSAMSGLYAEEPDAAHEAEVFGGKLRSESALIGIFYDLKQDQKRQPMRVDFFNLVAKFLNSDWDEGVLNAFYRVSRPLYATSVFIPYINADTAPAAFGAEKNVKPSQWLIHYKGQVRAPEAGTFRFIGMADDFIAAAINGKTVLAAGRFHGYFPAKWHPSSSNPKVESPAGPMVGGDWFKVKAGDILDLDVLVGERPGGAFGAWLQIEKQGTVYQSDRSGRPIFPVFQVSRIANPFKGRSPSNEINLSIWPGVQ